MTDAIRGWLVWYRQHGGLRFQEEDTLVDAVRFSEDGEESGDLSTVGFEDPSGNEVGVEALAPAYAAVRHEEEECRIQLKRENGARTHKVTIASYDPDVKGEALYKTFASREAAEAAAAALHPRFGERVSVSEIR